MPAQVRVDRLKQVYTAAKGLNFGFRLRDFPSAPAQNGVSRYQPQLLRVTIRFCRQSEASSGVRQFIEHELVRFGSENPATAVYVLPVRNTTPTLRGEYSNGRQAHINIKNFDLDRVCLYMNYLRTRSGQPIVKFEMPQTAFCPSVQGQWNPTLSIDPKMALAASKNELPNPEFDKFRSLTPSASEYVLRQMEKVEQS